MTDCPYCGEQIDAGAEQCPLCGEYLVERESTTGGKNRGLLIVLALVVGILACLCLVPTVIGFMSFRFNAGAARAAATQAHLAAFQAACAAYEVDTGAYPQQFSELWTRPAGASVWNGPYIRSMAMPPRDVWGNPFVYQVQGSGYVITSYGADGAPGGTGAAADQTVTISGASGSAGS